MSRAEVRVPVPFAIGQQAGRGRRRRLRGAIAATAALALLLAACGDGDDDGEDAVDDESAATDEPESEDEAEESQEDAGDFYEGQQVTMTVPYGTGGGTDTTARFLSPLLERHTPGSPAIQVNNEPGANTLIGSNKFAASDPDGSRLFMSGAATSFNYLLSNPDAEYSYAEWTPLLISPQGNIVYVSPDVGVDEPADLLNPSEPYILPVQSVEGSDLTRVITLDLLGLDFQVVAGYEGGGAARVAFEQGEANINGDTTSTYIANVQPLVDEGLAIPMYSFGFVDGAGEVIRDPAAPDLPHVGEVYEEIHGSPPEGEMWEAYKTLLATYVMQKIVWIPNDAPQEAIDAWYAGVEGVLEDPEYAAGVEEILGGYELITGDEMESVVREIATPEQSSVDWVYDYLLEDYDIDLTG